MRAMKFIEREKRLALLRSLKLPTEGSRVKAAREALKLSQKALGEACGVSGAAVSQWETGTTKEISGRHMVLAAAALDVATRWIALVDDDPLRYNWADIEEEELLATYRELRAEQKDMVRTMMEALRGQNPSTTVNNPYPTADRPWLTGSTKHKK